MTVIKKYDELQFTDQFMFAKVMRDPDTCKQVLELLLGVKLKRIENLVERSRTNQEWRREYVKLAANYRMFLEDGRREGLEPGREEGRSDGYRALIIDNLSEGVSSDLIIEKLQKYFELSEEEATIYFKKFSPFEED